MIKITDAEYLYGMPLDTYILVLLYFESSVHTLCRVQDCNHSNSILCDRVYAVVTPFFEKPDSSTGYLHPPDSYFKYF